METGSRRQLSPPAAENNFFIAIFIQKELIQNMKKDLI